jgi:threonine dehydrogenase-like Zn-dependent dehydrogenase
VSAEVPREDPAVAGRVALVLECSGHEQAAVDGCRVVRKRGEVVQVGAPWRRQTELSAHELLHLVFHRYVVLRSGWEWELPLEPADFRAGSIFGNVAAALDWLVEGRIAVDDLYALRSPQDAQDAYQALLHHRGERLAVVFDWS